LDRSTNFIAFAGEFLLALSLSSFLNRATRVIKDDFLGISFLFYLQKHFILIASAQQGRTRQRPNEMFKGKSFIDGSQKSK